MPIETLTGPSAYIDDLNPDWPTGPDDASGGDNHIRGLKNVLLNTLPNVSGPITRTHTELSNGSVPSGSVMLFYQAAAPTGWTRNTGIANTFMLRVVATASDGGGSGGTHDPIINSVVPSHTHTVSATSSGENVDHSHNVAITSGVQNANHEHLVTGTTGVESDAHTHSMQGQIISGSGRIAPGGAYGGVDGIVTTGTEQQTHTHNLSIWTGGVNANHSHAVVGATTGRNTAHSHTISATSAANADAANWQPRYMDVILCTKD